MKEQKINVISPSTMPVTVYLPTNMDFVTSEHVYVKHIYSLGISQKRFFKSLIDLSNSNISNVIIAADGLTCNLKLLEIALDILKNKCVTIQTFFSSEEETDDVDKFIDLINNNDHVHEVIIQQESFYETDQYEFFPLYAGDDRVFEFNNAVPNISIVGDEEYSGSDLEEMFSRFLPYYGKHDTITFSFKRRCYVEDFYSEAEEERIKELGSSFGTLLTSTAIGKTKSFVFKISPDFLNSLTANHRVNASDISITYSIDLVIDDPEGEIESIVRELSLLPNGNFVYNTDMIVLQESNYYAIGLDNPYAESQIVIPNIYTMRKGLNLDSTVSSINNLTKFKDMAKTDPAVDKLIQTMKKNLESQKKPLMSPAIPPISEVKQVNPSVTPTKAITPAVSVKTDEEVGLEIFRRERYLSRLDHLKQLAASHSKEYIQKYYPTFFTKEMYDEVEFTIEDEHKKLPFERTPAKEEDTPTSSYHTQRVEYLKDLATRYSRSYIEKYYPRFFSPEMYDEVDFTIEDVKPNPFEFKTIKTKEMFNSKEIVLPVV